MNGDSNSCSSSFSFPFSSLLDVPLLCASSRSLTIEAAKRPPNKAPAMTPASTVWSFILLDFLFAPLPGKEQEYHKVLAGTKKNDMQGAEQPELPIYVADEVLQANPKFKELLSVLA